MSPDPEKSVVIWNWPPPKCNAEVKRFLQTVQLNSKFMGGGPGELSHPELTEPLKNRQRRMQDLYGEKERCQVLKKSSAVYF